MAEKDCRRTKGKLFPAFGNCLDWLSANTHVRQAISPCPAAPRHISDTGQQAHTSKPDKNTAPTLAKSTRAVFSVYSRFKSLFSHFIPLPLYFYPCAISSRICPSASPTIRHLKLFPLESLRYLSALFLHDFHNPFTVQSHTVPILSRLIMPLQ